MPLSVRAVGDAPVLGALPHALAVVRLPAVPVAIAGDSRTGRVFVVTQGSTATYSSGLTILDAATGRVVSSPPLTLPDPQAAGPRAKPEPVSAWCPGCIAVDEHSGRVFVLGAASVSPGGPLYVFTIDAATGRLLTTTSLRSAPANCANPAYPSGTNIIVDSRSNRVFASSGATNRLAVLDATTGKLLQDLAFPNLERAKPSSVLPLGVDSRGGRFAVLAPNGLALLDERTGGHPHYDRVRSKQPQGIVEAAIDGPKGRAILAVEEADKSGDANYYIETINLANGKVLGSFGTGPYSAHVQLVDEQSGRTVVYESSSHDSLSPAQVNVVDDTTGSLVGGYLR